MNKRNSVISYELFIEKEKKNGIQARQRKRKRGKLENPVR
jgi:hypothetical protein